MKNIYTDNKLFSQLDTPFKKLMELNIKTIQSLAFIKPGDLSNVRRPEEVVERHMEMIVRNSHMVLDYMRDTFNILENHWLSVGQASGQKAEQVVREATSVAKKTVKKAASTAKKVVKKSASSAKAVSKVAAKAKPKAKIAAKAGVKKAVAKKAVAKKVAAKSAVKAKSAIKAIAKPAVKSALKSKAKISAKPAVKSAPKKVAKPMQSKSKITTTINPVKPEVRSFADKSKHSDVQSKNVGHSMPKVGGMVEKSAIKDLGLLNKGPRFPN